MQFFKIARSCVRKFNHWSFVQIMALQILILTLEDVKLTFLLNKMK